MASEEFQIQSSSEIMNQGAPKLSEFATYDAIHAQPEQFPTIALCVLVRL